MMRTSDIGRAVLRAREGEKLTAYKDSVGVWTIGTGHSARLGSPPVFANLSITKEESDRILAADLVIFEKAVNAAVKVPLTQNQFDACVSLAFNIGGAGFSGSTVVRRINANLMKEAADAFLLWNKPSEILSRRFGEREQFMTPYENALPRARAGETTISASYAPKVEKRVSEAPVAPAVAPVPRLAVAPVIERSRGLLALIARFFKKG